MVRERSRFVFLGTLPKIKFGYVSDGDIMAKEELTHKVYLATFGRPRYIMEIGEMIYGVKKDTYPKLMGENGAIKKCLKRGWIKKIDMPTPEEKPPGFDKRIYYQAEIEPIIDSIMKRIEETLHATSPKQDELALKNILRHILTSRAFRYWIEVNLPKDYNIASTNGIEFILSFLDILFIIFERNDTIKEQFKRITKTDDYEKAIDLLRKDEGFRKKLPELTYLFYGEQDVSEEIKKDLPYLFIAPEIPLLKMLGFSDFGMKYYIAESLSKNTSKLLSD